MGERYMLLEADVLDALRLIPSESVDAVLSDPPYALGTREPTLDEILAYLTGSRLDTGGDFMNKKWDLPSVEVLREMYRVMRPGAYAILFGGTRMFDMMTVGLRAAGFEIRDCFSWMYGSGMPKSLHVSKAIDEKLGLKRPVIGTRVLTGNAAISTKEKGGTYGVQVGTAPPKTVDITGPASEAAALFEGHGTGLKPCWEPAVLVRKPLGSTVAEAAMKHGTGGINVDGCRIDFADSEEDADGRWPPNVLFSHLPECRLVGTRTIAGDPRGETNGKRPGGFGDVGAASGDSEPNGRVYGNETIESWDCPPWCPVATLDAQSGNRPGMNGGGQHRGDYGGGMFGAIDSLVSRGDSGGASRFFATFHGDEVERFKYCSKASRAEREFGCEHLPARSGAEAVEREEGSAGVNNPRAGAGRTSTKVHNYHPTLKPIALVRWLATLLLPPQLDRPRRLLIPYSGAGSECIGAYRAGWDEIVGIERESDFVQIANARLVRWAEVPTTMSEAEAVGEARVENKKRDPKQTSMFK